jgi:hypothetical protein
VTYRGCYLVSYHLRDEEYSDINEIDQSGQHKRHKNTKGTRRHKAEASRTETGPQEAEVKGVIGIRIEINHVDVTSESNCRRRYDILSKSPNNG